METGKKQRRGEVCQAGLGFQPIKGSPAGELHGRLRVLRATRVAYAGSSVV